MLAERTVFHSPEVHALAETGLPQPLLVDLMLKHAFMEGSISLSTLAERTKLSPAIIDTLYRQLNSEQLCETKGMSGDDYSIALTARGRAMADVALKRSQYAGAAPVPLAQYRRAVTKQAAHINETAESLKSALGDLVLPDDIIADLGTALVTGGTILLYGSTGNGKTSIAERLHRVFNDLVYIPYAVEVSGYIVSVFDPLVHRPEKDQPPSVDRRWVLCRRPMVKVGGEMRAEMLEPQVDEITRICMAPLQMKANNGILLIDDFGRQRITARELLNRWIVPLDRHTDILSLPTGVSFEIPFELLVVFASNLALSDLGEDAFMRRIRNKIKIDAPGEDVFRKLIGSVCRQKNLACTPDAEDYLVEQCAQHSPNGLRACYPEDLTTIVCGTAAFERRSPSLRKEDIDKAVRVYFVR